MFRRAVIKALPTRGGGHGHPDFPFLGYYKHKRIITPLQSNLWVYDGMNPEFLVDIMVPQYTFGHILSRNLLFAWIIPLSIGYLIALVFYSNFKRPFIPSTVTDDNDPVRKFLKKIKHDAIIQNFKHPIGHQHTYLDEGWTPNASTYVTSRYNL
ncbi:hypothetical protein SteCoe_27909 [Stentor coeruleus]|uniref:Uncharacterized protein n=1 Tax=Stentor coeruleus TaxID=5963 RepID=A0A1R2B9D3_9CILI|nr:hypothetical protein SteCoe_27909 [Stentor coeruleus]